MKRYYDDSDWSEHYNRNARGTGQWHGETIMMAPAAGFYSTSGMGMNQVRLAYVLNKKDIQRALFLLEKALEQFKSVEKCDARGTGQCQRDRSVASA